MEIGIISDTHLKSNSDYSGLIKKVNEGFCDCDLIIHAGDVTNIKFIKDLEKIAPVEVVSGNMDDDKICNKYPSFKILEYFERRIGISHILPSMSLIKQEKIDIMIHGHIHYPEIREHDENGHQVLIINPGSPTRPRSPPQRKMYKVRPPYPSMVILNIDEELSSAYILSFKV